MIRESALPRKALRLWQIRCGLLTAIPCTAFFIAAFFVRWFLIPTILLLAAGFWLAFCYLPRYFAAFRFRSDSAKLTVRKGVWWQRTYYLPCLRTVYVSTFSTPLAQAFGLKGLCIKLIHGWLILPEMTAEQVETLLSEAFQ